MAHGRFQLARRFIPARVGNAWLGGVRFLGCAVHPRACGERCCSRWNSRRATGSSPRVWGTPSPRRSAAAERRFIPARVGNAWRPRRSTWPRAVHPRACGERLAKSAASSSMFGSSPRVWGTRLRRCRGAGGFRFIPARVGNAIGAQETRYRTDGSSPRVWGTRHQFTAGRFQSPVHPRACGERASRGRSRSTRRRFIPARVGNAVGGAPPLPLPPVHPRACGERGLGWLRCSLSAGSSPRVWGTLHVPVSARERLRFIPARVGNARVGRGVPQPDRGSSPRVWGTRAGC